MEQKSRYTGTRNMGMSPSIDEVKSDPFSVLENRSYITEKEING